MSQQTLKTLLGAKVVQQEKSVIQKTVDRIGEIEDILKEVKDLIKEKEELRKKLLSFTEGMNDAEEVILDGGEYTAVFSPCSKKRAITDVEGYFKAVGEDIFLQTVDIPITKADKYLTASQKEELIQVSTGSRTLKAVIRKP